MKRRLPLDRPEDALVIITNKDGTLRIGSDAEVYQGFVMIVVIGIIADASDDQWRPIPIRTVRKAFLGHNPKTGEDSPERLLERQRSYANVSRLISKLLHRGFFSFERTSKRLMVTNRLVEYYVDRYSIPPKR